MDFPVVEAVDRGESHVVIAFALLQQFVFLLQSIDKGLDLSDLLIVKPVDRLDDIFIVLLLLFQDGLLGFQGRFLFFQGRGITVRSGGCASLSSGKGAGPGCVLFGRILGGFKIGGLGSDGGGEFLCFCC